MGERKGPGGDVGGGWSGRREDGEFAGLVEGGEVEVKGEGGELDLGP